MPAYDFKARFVPAVETGRKPCTIRKRRKDGRRPRVGMTAYLYHGLRRKGCRPLFKSPIVSVDEITIAARGPSRPKIKLAGKVLTNDEAEALAKLDGHDSAIHMRAFFQKLYGLPFTGDVSTWNPEVRL